LGAIEAVARDELEISEGWKEENVEEDAMEDRAELRADPG
jgi:hypothetical protein